MSTILKWAGNKTTVMPELIKHLPSGSRLVEPFAGSCAVMMATDYPAYLVADINPDLINLYQVIRDECEWVIDMAAALSACNNKEVEYYNIRDEFNNDKSLSELWRAVYFIYLNRHCYRGLCRYNRSGQFNTPYGNYKNPYLPKKEIIAFAEKAKRATFICASYSETLSKLQAGDVVYCDPPYDGVFSGYHSNGFTESDQRHLASTLEILASEGYPVIASNSNTPRMHSLYRNFIRHHITVRRCMGVAGGSSKAAAEIIAVHMPPAYLAQQRVEEEHQYHIHSVLSRIAAPSCCICKECEAPIPEARRIAIPCVDLCAACQEIVELKREHK